MFYSNKLIKKTFLNIFGVIYKLINYWLAVQASGVVMSTYISKNILIIMFAIVILACITIGIVLAFYRLNFPGPLLLEHDKWGVFGDFLGGVLNPILSFFGLIALLLTIILQSRELEATREDLELTRNELSKSSDAQQSLVEQQKNMIILQTILPLMNEIGTDDFGHAVRKIGELWRDKTGFAVRYRYLIQRRMSKKLSEVENLELNEIETARRKVSYLFHKLHRLFVADVIEVKAAKAVVAPDLADLLVEVIEKINEVFDPELDRNIYDFAREMYSDKERESARYINRSVDDA